MNRKKFSYKPSAVDALILGIIILTFLAFGGIMASDYFYNKNKLNPENNSQIQELLKERNRLEQEIQKYKSETDVPEDSATTTAE